MPKRLFSREGRAEKVTLVFTVRALAVAIAIFAMVVSFAIVGGYQGIAANHQSQQNTKSYVDQSHANRLKVEADLQGQIQDVACTLIAIVPVDKTVPGPFRMKVLAIIKKYDCVTYNKTHHPATPVIPKKASPHPKVQSSTPPVAGGAPSDPAKRGKIHHTPGPGSRTPKPSPAPDPPVPGPVASVPSPLLPVLAPICSLLKPLLPNCLPA